MSKKYLHCGNCWEILGEIPSYEPDVIFDTMDCSWTCKKCDRLNLSSDGISIKYDSHGDEHHIYVRENKEASLVEKILDGFDFGKDFKQELFVKHPKT